MAENYIAILFGCLFIAACGRSNPPRENPHPAVPQGREISHSGPGEHPAPHGGHSPPIREHTGLPAAPTARQTATPHPSPSAWYDPSPLLASVRPHVPDRIPRLDDLPFYELHIDLNRDKRTFLLKEKLWFTNTTGGNLGDIVLRLYANTVGTRHGDDRASIRFLSGRCTKGPDCQIGLDSESTLIVRLKKELPPHGRVCIHLDLLGRLQYIDSSRTNIFVQGLEGMAMMNTHGAGGNYGLLSQGDGITSLANFYAVLGRRQAGRWARRDHRTMGDLGSDDMGHVRAHIITDPGVEVVSTGVSLETPKTQTNGRKALTFVAALVRDFSILLSPDFEVSRKRVGEVSVSSYYLRAEKQAGLKVLDAAVHAIDLFEKRFGPYPYRDFDVVEAPLVGGAGGVEFAGLVTVASMLYRPADHRVGNLGGLGASGGDKIKQLLGSMLEFVVVHEVAHQYWHGLVGSDSRAHPFDDEALAQYSALLYMEDRYGQTRATREAERQVAMGYRMMRLSGTPDGPADRPVSFFGTPLAYGGLVYGKAPFVYRELRRAVGDRVFFDTLRKYVRRYQFRLAPNRAFISMLASQNVSVRAIARHWLDEKHGDKDLGKGDMTELMNMIMGPQYANSIKALGLDDLPSSSGEDAMLSPEMKEILDDINRLKTPGRQPTQTEIKHLEHMLNKELGIE